MRVNKLDYKIVIKEYDKAKKYFSKIIPRNILKIWMHLFILFLGLTFRVHQQLKSKFYLIGYANNIVRILE